MKKEQGQYLGCLMGLAVGDALGTTLEFKRPARVGDTILIEGTVIGKSRSTNIIDIEIKAVSLKNLLASGLVRVKILN